MIEMPMESKSKRASVSQSVADETTDADQILGRRERNKLEKSTAIQMAARELFGKRGFEKTTMRAIARKAGVGFGSLFFYAQDKRDLLFMVFADEMSNATLDGFKRAERFDNLLDQLVGLFGGYYRLFAKMPALSRDLLRELSLYYSAARSYEKVQPSRERLLAEIAGLVDRAKAAGWINTEAPSHLIASLFFFTYLGAVRHWLAGNAPDAQVGEELLRDLFRLQIYGLGARPAD